MDTRPVRDSFVSRGSVGLTPRQRQILRLLCEGKANKEIARELDIGVGTVKQHLVGLFKRLNVRNRSMAVSRGLSLLAAPDARAEQTDLDTALTDTDWLQQRTLARRPCVVLSLALPDAAPAELRTALQRALAARAFDARALLIPRDQGLGDLLFGVRRSSENDLLAAAALLSNLCQDARAAAPTGPDQLRVAIDAGMAVVSKDRRGAWTGEAVATPAVARTRHLLQQTADGELSLGAGARDLLRAFGAAPAATARKPLPLCDLPRLFLLPSRSRASLVGRDHEWARLNAALTPGAAGRVIRLEGERGMGKSSLCQAALSHCQSLGGRGLYLRTLPDAGGAPFRDAVSGAPVGLEQAIDALSAPIAGQPDLLVIDDLHLLPRPTATRVLAQASPAAARGRVVLLSGVRSAPAGAAHRADDADRAEPIRLRRLPDAAIRRLIDDLAAAADTPPDPEIRRHICRQAAGVPFFAVELARASGDELPLPLLAVIAARLDGFELDWRMLQTLAETATSRHHLAGLSEDLGQPLAQVRDAVSAAVRAGILTGGPGQDGDEPVAFRHPLIRRAVATLGI
ncbi:helix-turn-helix transcriptional regulator [Thiohalocapsa marina]|nr:LuxR C-terminal-related transcriptional regulator [Thiohalocapsa marina]